MTLRSARKLASGPLRAPLLARAARKAHLLWVWLRVEHPRVWQAIWVLSRPVVVPLRLLARALRR